MLTEGYIWRGWGVTKVQLYHEGGIFSSGILPGDKSKTARFESRRKRRLKSSGAGLLSAHANQAKQIIKARVDPKWMEPRVALGKAG